MSQSDSGLKSESSVRESVSYKNPIIAMGPANQNLPINTIAVLPCQASGNPKPSIRWFRDQKPITEMDSSSRLMVEETGTLVIDSKFIIDKE